MLSENGRGPIGQTDHVLALLTLGYTRAQIADELDVSTNVVKQITRRLCRRYDTNVEGLRALALDDAPEQA